MWRKLLNQRHGRRRGGDPPAACAWILCAQRPAAAIDVHRLPPLAGWAAGLYATGAEGQPRIVVIPDLPRTPETLLLRLLGRGRVLAEALAELRASRERVAIAESLVAVVNTSLVARLGATVEPPEEDMIDISQELARMRRERAEGHLEALVAVVEARLGRALDAAERSSLGRLVGRSGTSVAATLATADADALARLLRAD